MTLAPVLNYKELAAHVGALAQALGVASGAFVDRVIVPERRSFPGGYLKAEWAIRLQSRALESGEATLIFSVRPRKPYVFAARGRGPKAAGQATHSVFDLTLGKSLRGARLLSARTLPRERVVELLFSIGGGAGGELALFLFLIPAAPEAVLAERAGAGWRVVVSTRKGREPGAALELPDGSRAPASLEARDELIGAPDRFAQAVERSLDSEAMELRLKEIERKLKEDRRLLERRIADFEETLDRARREPDWQKLGDLLKAHFHSPPPVRTEGKESYCEVMDYESGQAARVPWDPKLDLKGQLTRLYNLARRAKKRVESSEGYAGESREKLARVAALEARLAAVTDWKSLEALETAAGIATSASPLAQAVQADKRRGAWPGRSFLSKDRMPIWVGRSSRENLELVTRYSKGNDMWLHVRGRPGAHVLIPLPQGKSAPLETLLDAAHLCIHFSGGTDWGKTDVDYTFRKNVKRIKDSTEVSYTGNKTLTIDPDRDRLARLLDQDKT